MTVNRPSANTGTGTATRILSLIIGISYACVILLSSDAVAEEMVFLGKEGEYPCNSKITLYVDAEEKWQRSLDDMRKLDYTVSFTEGPQKKKQGVLLADLMKEAENIQAVEVSTCTGKLRRFNAAELEQKQNSLYFIITNYRGLKLHNAAGEEKKKRKKGSKLKGIDRIRLITKPAITQPE